MNLRCDMGNMLRLAAEYIDPTDDHGYRYSIERLVEHIEELREGKLSLDAFADFYLLRPKATGAVA